MPIDFLSRSAAAFSREDFLSRQVEHRLKAEVRLDASALRGWTDEVRNLLAEHEEAIRKLVGDLPKIPAHVADYPTPQEMVNALTESILNAARRMIRGEIAKATGDVEAFLPR